VIEIEHVGKRFGAVTALCDVSLHIAAGERVAFVGSNGSGKTTLLRALLGLLRVSGSVRVGGFDVARSPELALRQIAYIPQIAPPLEAPVRELVRAYAALRALPAIRIEARAAAMGLDLDTIAALRFRDLSGGMKQKLLAALALATDAAVIVCDEPTANLDAEARSALFSELERRPRRHVVILCSHREQEIHSLVDRVVELRDGAIASDVRRERSRRPLLQVVP
jgi:ABC-2 type transport system ATP-binding protein